jgi:hypothetical protein
MKTALQQFIEDELRNETKEMAYYLAIEKDQIINAFGNGEYITFCKDRLDYDPVDYKFSNSEEYYDSTYTQSSE